MPPFMFGDSGQAVNKIIENLDNGDELTIEQKLSLKKSRVTMSNVLVQRKFNYSPDALKIKEDALKVHNSINKILEINSQLFYKNQEQDYLNALLVLRDNIKKFFHPKSKP